MDGSPDARLRFEERRKEGSASVEEDRKRLLASARQQSARQGRQARDADMRHTAKSLVDRLKKRQDEVWENLKENQDLAVELPSQSGSVIRIVRIDEYSDSNDTLHVVGFDDTSGEECEAIVTVENFYVIFRVREVSNPERKRVGFN